MRGSPGFFSAASRASVPIGLQVRDGEALGYHMDFSLKARRTDWPPPPLREGRNHVGTIQWGLGCFERYLKGEGEGRLAGAIRTAEYLLELQERGGDHDGAWLHHTHMRHTFRVRVPWVSAMAQGEGASLLVRVHAATGENAFADAAQRALRPMAKPLTEGGVRADLGGGFFLEEYPTDPPSHVLNGGIFALWGYYDVAVALDDAEARGEFERGVDSLVENIPRWDTGDWSRYDLMPRRVVNVASSFYHALHINQLRAMQRIAPRPRFQATAERFERYRDSRAHRTRAFARKAVFRILVPRHPLLAHRTPFAKGAQPEELRAATANDQET